MFKRLTVASIAALLTLLFSFSLQAQDSAASLEEQSRQAYAEGKYLRFYIANKKLHKMRPQVPEYMYNIVIAAALMNKNSTAYHFMYMMQQQGLSYDFNENDDTKSIRSPEAYGHINNLLVEAGKPVGEGAAAFTVAGDPPDFGAIAWDDSRDIFLVGTRHLGQILGIAADGSSQVLIESDEENGLWAVNGLAVDDDRKRLWVSSAAVPAFSRFGDLDRNRGGLFEFDLESLELLGRYNLPVDATGHELGSVEVTEDGHVYVIDHATPIIYRKIPDGSRLEAFVTSKDLVNLTDIAVSPDNSRLFVSDSVMGVFIVDPVAQQSTMLAGPDNLNLAGILGIEYSGGQLFIIQGGISPQRLMRLELDSNGSTVNSISPMASGLELFDRPGKGTIREDGIYFFANTAAQQDASEMTVVRTSLGAGRELAPPDMEQLEKALKSQSQ
jgi:sugar lactone lactonase YvrE